MKNQSLIFLAAHEQARSSFLWAIALRARQQTSRRHANGAVGPAPEAVIEWTARRNLMIPRH